MDPWTFDGLDMNVAAWIQDRNHHRDLPLNVIQMSIRYICGDGCIWGSMVLDVDIAQTEDTIKQEIRDAVTTDINSQRSHNITPADVKIV